MCFPLHTQFVGVGRQFQILECELARSCILKNAREITGRRRESSRAAIFEFQLNGVCDKALKLRCVFDLNGGNATVEQILDILVLRRLSGNARDFKDNTSGIRIIRDQYSLHVFERAVDA